MEDGVLFEVGVLMKTTPSVPCETNPSWPRRAPHQKGIKNEGSAAKRGVSTCSDLASNASVTVDAPTL